MAEYFFAAGSLLLLLAAFGLAVLGRGGADIDRMLAIQLLSACAIAVLLLLAPAMGEPALLDAALLLALLAALAACAYRAALGAAVGPRGADPERGP